MKLSVRSLIAGVGLFAALPLSAAAQVHTEPVHFPLKEPDLQSWSFAGFFGTFDEAQLQRGYQVHKEVCSACHAMNLMAFRNLVDNALKFSPAGSRVEVRATDDGSTAVIEVATTVLFSR